MNEMTVVGSAKRRFVLRDDAGSEIVIKVRTLEEARRQCEYWVRQGTYAEHTRAIVEHVRITAEDGGETLVTVEIEPI